MAKPLLAGPASARSGRPYPRQALAIGIEETAPIGVAVPAHPDRDVKLRLVTPSTTIAQSTMVVGTMQCAAWGVMRRAPCPIASDYPEPYRAFSRLRTTLALSAQIGQSALLDPVISDALPPAIMRRRRRAVVGHSPSAQRRDYWR